MTLSFCAIVKNEAANLPRCLESVQGMVDQIVILDTGSTDETVTIAQSFGAEVHHFPWNNSFAAARNESLKYITGDWVLVLDADEALNPQIIPPLRQAMQQTQAIVINLIRQEIGAVQSPYSLVSRLFRRHPEVYFSRPYHAMVDDSVAKLLQREPQWQVINLPDVAILHYGYQPGTIASRDKLQKARQTMEVFLADHPDDPYVCAKLGALYVQMGDVQQGLVLLQRGLQSGKSDPPILYELHYHLGIAYRQSGNLPLAEQHYHAALQQPILDRLKLGAQNNLGSLLLAEGNLKRAKDCFETVIQLDPTLAIGYHNLGMTCKAIGQFTQAIDHYQQAIRLKPDYAEAYQNLGVVWLKLGRVNESLAAFRQAIDLHQQQNPSEADRLRQGLREMGFQV
ncbi:tetratricopeptide repeat protein [Leptolyngbya sp. ST-U4]|uniref:tetratricopeptide repeat protein n=1 Tax=Leptolyngbya sp. ST-U4 TaxID=2933912 RepID=UPI001995656C|nr:tetratricopeptide repeat protein [Cyanobacteria bacterium FACHB-502]